MTHAGWFVSFVATTVVLRGLGAGAILGVLLITVPTRRRIGVLAYAQFTRAQYRGWGVKAYGGLTVLGALLTTSVLALAIWWRASPFVVWTTLTSLVATGLGFVGTARALPTMTALWRTSDDDTSLLALLLDRFARWGTFSASWHAIAFILMVIAFTGAHR